MHPSLINSMKTVILFLSGYLGVHGMSRGSGMIWFLMRYRYGCGTEYRLLIKLKDVDSWKKVPLTSDH